MTREITPNRLFDHKSDGKRSNQSMITGKILDLKWKNNTAGFQSQTETSSVVSNPNKLITDFTESIVSTETTETSIATISILVPNTIISL